MAKAFLPLLFKRSYSVSGISLENVFQNISSFIIKKASYFQFWCSWLKFAARGSSARWKSFFSMFPPVSYLYIQLTSPHLLSDKINRWNYLFIYLFIYHVFTARNYPLNIFVVPSCTIPDFCLTAQSPSLYTILPNSCHSQIVFRDMFTWPLVKLLKNIRPCTEPKGTLGTFRQSQIPGDAYFFEICQLVFNPFDMCFISIAQC